LGVEAGEGDGAVAQAAREAQAAIVARASHRAFLHLRLCMLAARTIENEYLRNAFDMRNGAGKIHRLPTLAQGRCGFMLH
jgi:hypothetical protein